MMPQGQRPHPRGPDRRSIVWQSKGRLRQGGLGNPHNESGDCSRAWPRAEGATKCQHRGERFGGRMTGRSCGGSQDHSTLTSHERAAAHSITSSASTVGRISRPSALAVLRLMAAARCRAPARSDGRSSDTTAGRDGKVRPYAIPQHQHCAWATRFVSSPTHAAED